jgi:hypothetical protein
MNCKFCGDAIPAGRLAVLPYTTTCVKCSDVKRVAAYQHIHGKTGHVWVVADADTAARIEKIQHRRGQSPGAGMRGQAKCK